MIEALQSDDESDAAISAMLPLVPSLGWTRTALRAALTALGRHPDDAEFLFPGGAADMIEMFCDLADRRMAATGDQLEGMRLSARVRALIATRLTQGEPHKDAIRRALGIMARPGNAGLATRCTARTVDAIWFAAGDTSADFSWYTKRASLAAVYATTLLYWLRDHSDGSADSLDFLDRRLAGLGRIGRLRGKLSTVLPRRSAARDASA